MPDRFASPSLLATIARRIIAFTLAAMAVEVVIVLADYYFDNAQLGSLIVQREAELLAEGVGLENGRWTYDLPPPVADYEAGSDSRVARIRSADGASIYSNCGDRCVLHLLPEEVSPPDRWTRLLSNAKPISVAGGRTIEVNGRLVFIEVAVVDVDGSAMWHALGLEFADHLAIPMTLQFVFVLCGSLVSVWLALRPVRIAAERAERVDPLDPENRIDVRHMPREIAELCTAVNRALARIGGLMREQRLFTTAVAHEIRTPLAMLQLELDQIDHPRARRMEKDIEGLARLVGQITALGRLEALDRKGFQRLDVATLGRNVVASVAPWVYDRNHSIDFVDDGATTLFGDRAFVEDALVNLVSNAVTHTPAGTAILLRAGPGPRLSVIDDAGLYRRSRPAAAAGLSLHGVTTADGVGIGIEIVKRIAAMHGGRLQFEVQPGLETAAILLFPGPEEASTS